MHVPDDPRAIIGKREFRQLLKASSLAEAKNAVAIRRLMANSEMEDARRKIAITSPSSGAGQSDVIERLTAAALSIGLARAEVEQTIQRGLRAGKQAPRSHLAAPASDQTNAADVDAFAEALDE